MIRRVICGVLILTILLSVSAFAADESGYLFQTVDAMTDETLLSRVEPISAERNLYRTDDFAVLQLLEAAGQLVYWEEDALVMLTELSEELTALGERYWADTLLGMQYARDNGITGEGIRIGLIDSGVRSDFAALTGANIVEGINYLAAEGSEARTDTTDSYGHGSFVASILALPQIGIAPDAELVPLKCFDGKTGKVSYIISAIYDAVDIYRVNVLNLSLGTSNWNTSLYNAVRYAFDAGVIVAAATGNNSGSSTGQDPYYYPAAYAEVVGVGAVDASKNIAQFSYQNDSVWVTAPGNEIRGLSDKSTNYVSGKGTSFATPFVSGAAALALSVDAALDPLTFMDLLALTAEDLGEPGYDHTYGYGLLDVGLLLAYLQEDTGSAVLSGVEGSYSLSAYLPQTAAGSQCMLAQYDSGGRFLTVDLLTVGTDRLLWNLPLSEGAAEATLFVLEQGTWAPLRCEIRY